MKSYRIIRKLARLALCIGWLSVEVFAQAPPPQSAKLPYGVDRANVPDAVAKVKSGDFAPVHVDLLVRGGAVEAIPALQQQFTRVQDPILKAKIAAGLVRLGDKDDIYWDYLVSEANVALRDSAPDYTSYNSEGHAVSQPSPEFEAWVNSTGASPETAAENSLYYFPGRIAMLGWSRDPRAVTYLREGLSSRNYMIQIAAAKGLAEIGDQNSIPLIIEACRKAPSEVAQSIAESLVYFDDEAAQAAVDRYMPKDIAKVHRNARASGQTKPLSPPLYDKAPN
jgi:HEAT repeat protein